MKLSAITPWGRLINTYERALVNLFKQFQSTALTRQSLRQIANDPQFKRAAELVARRMVAGVTVTNAASWREAAMLGTKSREIYQALKSELHRTKEGAAVERIVRANAEMIRSIPLNVAEKLTDYIAGRQQAGARAGEVAKEIQQRIPGMTASRIKLIARTEIGKSEAALTRARAEALDVRFYVWQTSEDQRVRKSHRNLDKVLVSWDDPPQPELLIGEKSTLGHGNCGEYPNCRCVSLPLLSLDEVSWPARVYFKGAIVRMNRDRFSKFANMPIAA